MPDPRVAVIQFRPRKAEYAENLRRIGAVFTQAAGLDAPPDIVVFPEAATSGYFLEGGVREVAVPAGTLLRDLQLQHAESGCPRMDVVIGFFESFKNHIYNSALYASLEGDEAEILHVHRKVFLPTYGVFD
ncbi:MAG: nitrilase-related carbon-nitrogen hydrolase, partial [Gemmatimonadales bacterium]